MVDELDARSRHSLLRILDANRNRALEALRVVEEHARFVLGSERLAARAKELRHRLHLALARPQLQDLVLHRDVEGDVLAPPPHGEPAGAHGIRATRETSEEVALANLGRAKEALRALEEYAKPLSAEGAALVERIRYEVYALERELALVERARERLHGRWVYVILEEKPARPRLLDLARAALDGGARIFQLRDKGSSDRARLEKSLALREILHGRDALLIVNDRPDVAALAGADGVHLGQDDLPPREARALLPPGALVGGSVHDEAELARSTAGGADYVGIGTVFPSPTKPELAVRGLDVLRSLAPRAAVPVYAIGGIRPENAAEAIEAGAQGVAVSSGVLDAPDVARATAAIVEAVEKARTKR